MNTIKTYLRKPWVIAVLALLVVVVYFVARGGRAQGTEDVVTVKSGTVSESVSVTGKVKPASAVDLSFEQSGRVVVVAKTVGETVKAGDVIVRIDGSDSAAGLAQAEAQVRLQRAKLSELEAGMRPEALSLSQTKVENAEADVALSRTSFLSALQSAYSSGDDAIRNKIDDFFINPRSEYPQLAFQVTITPQTSIESGRAEVERRLEKLKPAIETATTSSDLSALSTRVKQDLSEIKLFLDNLSLAVNALSPTGYLSQSLITGWKASMAAARTEVNTAITSIIAAEDKFKASQSALALAKGQLNIDAAGNVAQQIEAQQASVAQAEANVAAAYAQYKKTFLRAPIDGVVTKQDAKLGETIPPNVTLVSVMSGAQFQIEANVAEADIAKVKTGQEADVTLDAYGSDAVFKADVAAIDPAETIVDGVPTYKTTFQFTSADDRIKSGMTANIDIKGQSRDGVLSVPQRAIISRNGGKYVVVRNGKEDAEVQVKVGLRGSDGSIEITDGLKAGDVVVVSQGK